MILNIPSVPPSLNKYVRMHWKTRKNLQGTWDRWIIVAFGNLPEEERRKFPGKVVVSIEYSFKSTQPHDFDNYTPKVIMDALKHKGIIVDDSNEVCEVSWKIETGTKQTCTRITIEEQ